tara:strand:+ start:93 stop:803 length:711 start_codon:yes stop_codon:yes gene_type:complete
MNQIKLKVTHKLDLTSRLNVFMWKNKLLIKIFKIFKITELLASTLLYFSSTDTDFYFLKISLFLQIVTKWISRTSEDFTSKYVLNRNINENRRIEISRYFNYLNLGIFLFFLFDFVYYYFQIPNFTNNYFILLAYEFWKIVTITLLLVITGYILKYHHDNHYFQSIMKNFVPIENEFILIDSSNKKIINDTCPICLENDDLNFVLNCGHGFHKDCISKWILKNDRCPLCNISALQI